MPFPADAWQSKATMTKYITEHISTQSMQSHTYQVLRLPIVQTRWPSNMHATAKPQKQVTAQPILDWEHQQALTFVVDHRPWISGGASRLQYHPYDASESWERALLHTLRIAPEIHQNLHFVWLECIPQQSAIPVSAIQTAALILPLHAPLVWESSRAAVLIPHGHAATEKWPTAAQHGDSFIPVQSTAVWRTANDTQSHWTIVRQMILLVTTHPPHYLPVILHHHPLNAQQQPADDDPYSSLSHASFPEEEDCTAA